jgi:hypothetical protein
MPTTSGIVYTSQLGCLLPVLIILNLFFGKFIFNSTRLWLGVEGILILLFFIKIHAFTRKISGQFSSEDRDNQNHQPQGKVVDIQGQVVEEREKLE